MTDWSTVILTGLFTGIGVESAKVIHDLYIKPRMMAVDKKIKEKVKNGKDGFELEF